MNTFYFFSEKKGSFLANYENIRWNCAIHVSVITRTNCRNVMDPGMHGYKADKVTQIQLQICSSDKNAQISVIFGQFDGSRLTS